MGIIDPDRTNEKISSNYESKETNHKKKVITAKELFLHNKPHDGRIYMYKFI